jgi:hypothetical protein
LAYDECGTASLNEHFGEMLFIIDLMLSLIQVVISRLPLQRRGFLRSKTGSCVFFSCFFKQGFASPWECPTYEALATPVN